MNAGPGRWRLLAVIALLAVVIISWAALPLRTGAAPRIALIVAFIAVLGSLGQLALARTEPRRAARIDPLPDRLLGHLVTVIRALPWTELAAVLALVLEVQHPDRPWHTGLLGIALVGYLLAVHLAETGAPARVIQPQLPLLAAGIGLLALAVGAASLPALPVGSVSSVVRIIAATAAVLAGALALPIWVGRRQR